jgi:hypothetical protein
MKKQKKEEEKEEEEEKEKDCSAFHCGLAQWNTEQF